MAVRKRWRLAAQPLNAGAIREAHPPGVALAAATPSATNRLSSPTSPVAFTSKALIWSERFSRKTGKLT